MSVAIAGGGPGGVMLAYLLARAGVDVTLLESRGDFDREFRGDSIAPPVLDYLDRFGLTEKMLAQIPHTVSTRFDWTTPERTYVLADYSTSSAKYPYYALVPQAKFLPFLVEEVSRYPNFRVLMRSRVVDLLRDDTGRVTGLTYRTDTERHTLHADLVIGADGRNSQVRRLADITATELASSIDLCWIAFPRKDSDPDKATQFGLVTEAGSNIAVLGQGTTWQIGFTIPAGTFPDLRERGAAALRDVLRRNLPWLGDQIDDLQDTNQLTLLPIRITTVERWSIPGLLLIGDAAHVISPVGGNGINQAILDAAEAANRLVGPLTAAPVDPLAVDAATAAVEAGIPNRRSPSRC